MRATPLRLAAWASPVQNGPSRGCAAARRSAENLTMLPSGKMASSDPCSLALVRADSILVRLTLGWELTGSWQRATRMSEAYFRVGGRGRSGRPTRCERADVGGMEAKDPARHPLSGSGCLVTEAVQGLLPQAAQAHDRDHHGQNGHSQDSDDRGDGDQEVQHRYSTPSRPSRRSRQVVLPGTSL